MQAVRRFTPSLVKCAGLYNPARYFGVEFTMKTADDTEFDIECDTKENLLEVAQSNDVEIKSDCNGGGSCGLCHVVFSKDVFDKLPKAGATESGLLKKLKNVTPTSRLACQVKTDACMMGKIIEVPLNN